MSGVVLPGAGATVATEQIGGQEVQRVKLMLGEFEADGGNVSSENPMPTQDVVADAIRDMNDSMLYVLQAMLDKMPSITREKRVRIALTGPNGDEANGAFYTVNTGLVGEAASGRNYSRLNEIRQFSDMGSTLLYNNIIVS
jgi:hypothetical protein